MKKQNYKLPDKIGITTGIVFMVIAGYIAKSYASNVERLFWIIWLAVWNVVGNVAGTMFGQACIQNRKERCAKKGRS